jgi:transposase
MQNQANVLFFFVDAAHFVHGAFLGYLWCFVRLFIPSPSGRKRFNVLAALDAVSKEIITVTNETYINAESVCQLLAEIAKLSLDKPITLILDNARYQKCALVQNYAAALNIELLYLPSYSPHLNLIERFWKFVRKECLYSGYRPDLCEIHAKLLAHVVLGVKLFDTQFKRRLLKPLREFYFAHCHL